MHAFKNVQIAMGAMCTSFARLGLGPMKTKLLGDGLAEG